MMSEYRGSHNSSSGHKYLPKVRISLETKTCPEKAEFEHAFSGHIFVLAFLSAFLWYLLVVVAFGEILYLTKSSGISQRALTSAAQ